ncbi:nitroreductase family protein [Clostridium sp.]|uniref:nitroreductase family protein n=1 Tax=Clostridium sp. TaxID=1506 RepID=UPI0032173165
MNETIDLINNRVSLRKYADRDIEKEHLDAIINSAMRAPTAGNVMMYSMIVVKDDEKKKKLAKTCDNQPFIATAPVIIVFVADAHRLNKYFEVSGVKGCCDKKNQKVKTPDLSQLFLAAGDAFIAAQNAVVAAESLGVGSCYIGDIVENYETHREMFNLPNWATPVAMLCLGYYPEDYPRVIKSRFDRKYIVFDEEYKDISDDSFEHMYKEFEGKLPKPNRYDAENFGQYIYSRKFGSEFMNEMNRSLKVAVDHWKMDKSEL